MPELPDIEVFCRTLNRVCTGKKVVKVKPVNANKLRQDPKILAATIEGRKIASVYRSGKEMRIGFSNKRTIGLHLMLTGDLFLLEEKNERKTTIIEFHFSDGTALVLTDRMRNAQAWLDPEDKQGIDALDKALNFKKLKELIGTSRAVIKNVLLDQTKIRGIGNGYSDEILWEARISPYSIASAIPDEALKVLARSIRKVLSSAVTNIARKYPDLVQGEVRDFMKIHKKGVEKSPTGYPVHITQRGMLKMYYTDEQVLYK